MQVQVIETVDALRTLEPEWERLWSEDPAGDIFTSVDWFLTWWKHFGHGVGAGALVLSDGERLVSVPGRGARLHVLVVREKGDIVAIAPLIIVRGWWRRCPVRILALPLNNHGPRSGFIMSRAMHTACTAMVEHLVESLAWDIMLLDGIPRLSGVVPLFQKAAARREVVGQSNSLWSHSYLTLDGTWQEYLLCKTHNFRRQLRRSERALEQLGKVTVERFEGSAGVESGMPAFMEVDRESWKAKHGESIALQSDVGAYYRDLALRFARRKRCQIWILSIAHEPAAAFLCLCDKRQVLYTLKTAYKDKFAGPKYSPSRVLMAHIIQEAWQNGLKGIDFAGRMPFAERWASGTHDFERFAVFRNRMYPSFVWLVDRMMRRARLTKRSLARLVERAGTRTGGTLAKGSDTSHTV